MPTSILTYAKINLSLLVFPPQPDGYHPICSIFQTIKLHDTLTIQAQENKTLTITSNNLDVPTDQSNILTKIYLELKDKLPHGFVVDIKKNIPMGGGMAGGSTNAAGFLKYLNDTYLKYSLQELINLAKTFGADIPFFLVGGTALVTGIGEKISPIPTLTNKHYLLITPPIHCSTAAIFKEFDSHSYTNPTVIESPEKITKTHLGENSLKPIVFDLYPSFKHLETWANEHNKELYMSGSGATTFISFNSKADCDAFAEKTKQKFPDYAVQTTQPLSSTACV
jgi:4-diphosphocytidyl-2-C-methyl-D-erythritol kinase